MVCISFAQILKSKTMKKRITTLGLSVIMLGAGVFNSSCFGEFALVRKVYNFNSGVMGDDLMGRFVRTLLYYAMSFIPVYGIAAIVDLYILNLIEFWTGSNPLAMAPGETETQYAEMNGKRYRITASQNRFDMAEIKDGKEVEIGAMVFNKENLSWNYEKDNLVTELYRIKIQPNGNHLIEYRDVNGNLAYTTMNALEARYEDYLVTR
jgi:hypothetical protein